ncbi:hypothetical protein LQ318_15090 [Aliifodinibius salicampi]|uniref:Uncharacterized protein n=1 Tax=Fodinibius salicampi TaxID=1920655 RepID=A0ABT3Q295_9BACT|nr:hypothetical protein [Fodinibius salicampi]MCW9714235.1 hypothetical protein [Fodinibius salicampi]
MEQKRPANRLRRSASLGTEINEDLVYSVAPTRGKSGSISCFYHSFPHLFLFRTSRSLSTPHLLRPVGWNNVPPALRTG